MLLVNHPYGPAVEPVVGFVYGRSNLPTPMSAMSRKHFSVVGVGASTVTIQHTGQAAGRVNGEDVSTGMGVILRAGAKYHPVAQWDTLFFELTETMVLAVEHKDPIVPVAEDPIKLAEPMVEHKDPVKVEATTPYDENDWKDEEEDNAQLKLFIEDDTPGELGHTGLLETARDVVTHMFKPRPSQIKKKPKKPIPRVPMLEKMRAAKLRSAELDALDKEHKFGPGSIFHSSTLLEKPLVPEPEEDATWSRHHNPAVPDDGEVLVAKKKKRVIKPTVAPQ